MSRVEIPLGLKELLQGYTAAGPASQASRHGRVCSATFHIKEGRRGETSAMLKKALLKHK